jgi:hypothetical protein
MRPAHVAQPLSNGGDSLAATSRVYKRGPRAVAAPHGEHPCLRPKTRLAEAGRMAVTLYQP